jgi:hypothetical protein
LKQNLELIAALTCVILLTAAYLLASGYLPVAGGTLQPNGLLGHGIGIVGFVLMLATETLYSWRKTRRRARWGRTQVWLAAHIFTGIVGPYMVFLHTGFRFAGLAGIAFWLTLIVVGSGFVGRYIYTAIPRTPAGEETEAAQLQAAIDGTEGELQGWLSAHGAPFTALVKQMRALQAAPRKDVAALLRRSAPDRRYQRAWQDAIARLSAEERDRASDLWALLARRRALQRQAVALAQGRRLLAVWHAMHVPLASALFLSAIVHAVVALYYS